MLVIRKNSTRPFGSIFVFPVGQIVERREDILIKTEQIWDEFHSPLEQFIRRRISDETTAEDILQDMFLKIHQHMETLRDVRRLESWIYQITRNTIIDSYRSTRPTTTLEAAEVLNLPEELPDDDVVSKLLPCIRAMVRNLPELDRQALVLTEYQGLTQEELAELHEYLEITGQIEADPDAMLGKPVIRGTRITVELILRKLSEGASEAELLEAYPQLTATDIRSAITDIRAIHCGRRALFRTRQATV